VTEGTSITRRRIFRGERINHQAGPIDRHSLSPFILEATHFVTRVQNTGVAMLVGALILTQYPLRGRRLEKMEEDLLKLHGEKHARLVGGG
jgi:hypothetical protein